MVLLLLVVRLVVLLLLRLLVRLRSITINIRGITTILHTVCNITTSAIRSRTTNYYD